MSTLSNLEVVANILKKATKYDQVFGILPSGDTKVKRKWVRNQFTYFAQMVHPDHVPDAPYGVADSVFDDLRKLFVSAEKAIEAGTYDQSFKIGHREDTGSKFDTVFELRSYMGRYLCQNEPYRHGDFSLLYKAKTDDREVLVKITTEPAHNPLLEMEARRLKTFRENNKIKSIHSFLPTLIDTFIVPGPNKRQFRANVMNYNPGMLSITDIVKAFPNGLVPQHAAWIVRRVMAQPLAASMSKMVHASITPDHVLVDPIKHEPLHIGWLHSVEKTRLTMIIDRWKSFYPPEIFAKKVPYHKTDIYMAGMTSIYLFGGDTTKKTLPKAIPDGIVRLLMRCVNDDPNKRPDDGLVVLNDITKAIRDAWGRSYQPLLLPI